MESVTQEKKKLQSVICFEARAPTGYTFIPAGNPQLTTACKERCRKEGLRIHAVSTTPHATTHNLSLHVHRIGYHFPSTVVAAVCSELNLYLTSTGKALPVHTLGSLETRPVTDADKSQLTINTEARDAITDLFPNIPLNDLHQIIKTAFQKGQRKVGTASELPLARRAQLAVVAHIRHLYTDYDKLLKSGSFHDARSTVEQPTLAKLVAWRGDDENGQKVLEDVFREVIVISDDDDDSEVEEEAAASNRDQSVEILSSQARSQPISLVKTSALDPLREMSEEAPPGFRFVPAVPKKAADRRGFSRYQAWNRALTKYGNGSAGGAGGASAAGAAGAVSSAGAGPAGTATQHSPRHGQRHIGDSPRHREQPLEVTPRANPPSRFETPLHRTVTAPNSAVGIQGRGSLDGQRASQYGPRPILTTQKSEGHLNKSPRAFTASNTRAVGYPSTNVPIFVNGHKELHPGNRPEAPAPAPPTIRPVASQDYVLPSIEAPWPTDKRKMDNRLENMTKRMSLRSVTPKGEMMSGPGNGTTQPGSPDDPMSKRRRLAYLPPIQDSRDPWNRPIALPVSEAVAATSRSPYRRDDLVPEYRVDGNVRRDYPHQRETALDRIRFVDPMHPHSHSQSGPSHGSGPMPLPMSMPMPMPPGTNGPSDTRRTLPRPAYYGDRSPHTRPAVIESRWESDPAALPPASTVPAHVAPVPSSSGKLYADGFVRQVGFREVRPVEYFHHGHGHGHGHPRSQQTQLRAGDPVGQSFRARMPKLPHETAVGTAAAAATTHTHDQIHSHPPDIVPGNRQPQLQSQPQPRSPRERQGERQGQQGQGRPGSGLGKRRVHDPRAFQMTEQSRPIYVQRVESQPPPSQYLPEGRHVVIVD